MSAKPITPLVLAGGEYLLAKVDGIRYAVYRPRDPDDFGVVSHDPVPELSIQEAESLLQMAGAYIEKCAALEAALQKAKE